MTDAAEIIKNLNDEIVHLRAAIRDAAAQLESAPPRRTFEDLLSDDARIAANLRGALDTPEARAARDRHTAALIARMSASRKAASAGRTGRA